MKKSTVKILVTSVGGLIIPSLLSKWRSSFRFDYRFFGVDMDPNAIGRQFVDEFDTVPPANDKKYAKELLRICKRYQINYLLPFSDPEADVLSKVAKKFYAADITILGSGEKQTSICVNKKRLLQELHRLGLETPAFYVPKNWSEAKDVINKLGFPRNQLIIKPIVSAGSRGFRILTNEFSEFHEVFGMKRETKITLKRLAHLYNEYNERKLTPNLIFMEYLQGLDFNIDALCDHGKLIHCVAQERIAPKHGPVQIGKISHDKKIIKAVDQIVSSLNLHFMVNIEMAYPDGKGNRNPLLYEINPRPSAAIIATEEAGIHMLDDAIRLHKGEKLSTITPLPMIMYRYWDEYFE